MSKDKKPTLRERLLHCWRLIVEPSGRNCLFGVSMPRRWRVKYRDGYSQPMAYDVACDYAEIFNGTVERAEVRERKPDGHL